MQVNTLNQLILLRPVALGTVLFTLFMYLHMLLAIRRLNLSGKGSRLAAMFVGLQGRSALMLTLAWLKFCIICCLLLLRQAPQPAHYALIAGVCIPLMLLTRRFKQMVQVLLGTGVLVGGWTVAGTVQQYLYVVRLDRAVVALYWVLAVLLCICAVAFLVLEVTFISGERNKIDEDNEFGEIETLGR